MRHFAENYKKYAAIVAIITIILAIGTPIHIGRADSPLTELSFPLNNQQYLDLKVKLVKDRILLKKSPSLCSSPTSKRDLKFCDADADGISNGFEKWLKTDPTSKDSDNDGLNDRTELFKYRSNPIDATSPNHAGRIIECANEYFDIDGFTTSFKIPKPLTGHIGAGQQYHRKKCLECHVEKGMGMNFIELQRAIEQPAMKYLNVQNHELADLVAYLNRELTAKNCQSVSSSSLAERENNQSYIRGTPLQETTRKKKPDSSKDKKKSKCDNKYFDALGNTKPGQFEIPIKRTGKIAKGAIVFATTCNNGICHLGGEADVQAKLRKGKGIPTFNRIRALVRGPKMKLWSVKDQQFSDLTAFLNRKEVPKGCNRNIGIPTPTPTPPGELPSSCKPAEVFAVAKAACSSCHQGTNAYGGFRVDSETPWTATSPELRRALTSVKVSAMPPVGANQLNDAQKETFAACTVEGNNPIEPPPQLYNPGDPATQTSRFTLRRLSKLEYINSLKSIYGPRLVAEAEAQLGLHPEEDGSKKFTSVTSPVGYGHIDAYYKIAQKLTQAAVADNEFLSRYACGQASPTEPSHAVFFGEDKVTQGNWPGFYGNYSYRIATFAGIPDYTSGFYSTITNHLEHTWAASTVETRAPLKNPGGNRHAATWYSSGSYTINVIIPAQKPSRLALYFLDWDNLGRAVKITINDLASGALLDTRSFNKFSQGIYGVWEINKSVKITVTSIGAANATISGIFIGGPATNLGSESCLDNNIKKLGKIFFRRPLSSQEIVSAKAIFKLGLESKNVYEGFSALLSFFSQSPYFIYQIDDTATQAASGTQELTNYGIANRIAFALTKNPPDAALMQAADEGKLSDVAVRRSHALRLLNSEEGLNTFAQFSTELVGANYISPPPTDPTFLNGIVTTNLVRAMKDDIQSLIKRAVSRGGSFASIMTDRDAQLDEQLSTIYGATYDARNPSAIVSLNSNYYRGLITRAAVVSRGINSSPFHLAQMIDRNFLSCEPLNLPDSSLLPSENLLDPNSAPGQTLRQRLERATTAANCIGCHRRLNFVFAMSNYDPIGRWVTTETAKNAAGEKIELPLDTKTRVYFPGDLAGKEVDGPLALSELIAQSTRSAQCFYLKWANHALGREIDPEERSWILQEPAGSSQLTTQEVRSRIADIVSQQAFINVKPYPSSGG
jgi:hypothetical protein